MVNAPGVVRLALAGAVVLVWVGGPVAVVGALSREASGVRLAGDEPAWATVRPLSGQVEQRLGLALSWTAGPVVVAPAWDGIVEVVHVGAGDALRSGDQVAVVAGVTRIGFAGERPFSRHLQRGDLGPDVGVLHAVLEQRGLSRGPGDRFDRKTAAGVRALAAELGAPQTEVLDPAWFVHLTAPELVVTAVDLVVGAPAPAAGSQVLRSAATLVAARVTSEDWVARAVTGQAAVPEDGDASMLPEGLDLGTDERTVPDQAELRVRDSALEVTEDRGRVDDASLPVLAAAVEPGAAGVDAVAVSAPVVGSWAVPSAAVHVDPEGRSSLRVQRSGAQIEVDVEIIGSEGVSTTVVVGGLASSDLVQVPSGSAAER